MRKRGVLGLLMGVTIAMSGFALFACSNASESPSTPSESKQPQIPSENITQPSKPETPDDPPAPEHKHELNYVEAIPATCESDGNIAYYICAECGLMFSDSDGKIILENYVIPSPGHDYDVETIEPTCTDNGYSVYKCNNCDDEYTISASPLGHTYTDTVVAPACTENGYTLHKCTVCSNEYTDNEVTAFGHSYRSTVIEPTCTDGGYTVKICDTCGDETQSDPTPALGHEFGAPIVTVQPTCTESGSQERICERCEAKTNSELPPLGHDYTATVTDPTCTQAGFTVHVCATCGDTYTDGETPATGHSYVEAWSYDDDYHWHEAVCGCDIESEKFAHEHDDDGECICGHKEEWDYKLTYALNGDEYTVTGIKVSTNIAPKSLNVIIPSEYNGLPVTAIADDAFNGNQYMKTVEIPISIKKIGKGAFADCSINSATFENKSWEYSQNADGNKAQTLTLGNNSTNANYLKNKKPPSGYAEYYWFSRK